MTRKRYHDGEYIDLVWDGPVQEHYVTGHLTAEEFRVAVAPWSKRVPPMPADASVEHGFGRCVRAPNDDWGNRANVFQFSREPWDGFRHQRRITRWMP